MCGVVGISLDDISPRDLVLVKNILRETQIRGRHASGIAWWDGKSVECVKDSIPMTDLVDKVPWKKIIAKGGIRMIAHCRYSTSDLEFNQPLGDSQYMIAHNGVITQSPPETWEEYYDDTFDTRNDSEILLKEMAKGHPTLYTDSRFPGASISVVSIDSSGSVSGWRNTLRPLWRTDLDNGYIYTSTRDIVHRASRGDLAPVKMEAVGYDRDYQTR